MCLFCQADDDGACPDASALENFFALDRIRFKTLITTRITTCDALRPEMVQRLSRTASEREQQCSAQDSAAPSFYPVTILTILRFPDFRFLLHPKQDNHQAQDGSHLSKTFEVEQRR